MSSGEFIMPIPVQCPHCGRNHQVPDQMAGQRAKCNCGNAIVIPNPAAQSGMQPGQAPMQQAPQQQAPQQQAPQQPMPGQQMPAAPMQQMPMAADSAFAGMADDEMDDLFGPSGGEAASQAAAQPVEQEKKVPKILVGAGDSDEDTKKKSDEPDPLTGREKTLAVLLIVAGVLGEPFGGIVGGMLFGPFREAMQLMNEGGYYPMFRTVGSAAALVGCLGVMAIAGALAAKGGAMFRRKDMDVSWVHGKGIINAGIMIGGLLMFNLMWVNQQVIDKNPDFVSEIVTQEKSFDVEEEKETKPDLDVIFGEVLKRLGWIALLMIVPIYVAVMAQYIEPPKKKEEDDGY